MKQSMTSRNIDELVKVLKSFDDSEFVDECLQFWIIEEGSLELASRHHTDKTTRLGLYLDVYEALCYEFPRGVWPSHAASFLDRSRDLIEDIRDGFLHYDEQEVDVEPEEEEVALSVDDEYLYSLLGERFPMSEQGKRCHVEFSNTLSDTYFGITEEYTPLEWFSVFGQEELEDIKAAHTLKEAISIALESIDYGDPMYFDDDDLCVFVDRQSVIDYATEIWEDARVGW